MPSRFIATFRSDPSVEIEIEYVSRVPQVRSVRILSESRHLATKDLRLPLQSELLPRAIRAACVSLVAGDPPRGGRRMRKVEVKPGETENFGAISVVARVASHAGKYQQAAEPRRGRPPAGDDLDELRAVAAAYGQHGSVSDVLINVGCMSRSTAKRRVVRARELGLIDEARAEMSGRRQQC